MFRILLPCGQRRAAVFARITSPIAGAADLSVYALFWGLFSFGSMVRIVVAALLLSILFFA